MIRACLLALTLAIAGCSQSAGPERYADRRPLFDPIAFFQGQTFASGVFETRGGDPRRRFTQVLQGRMEGDTLVLDQVFTYEDGEVEPRTWRVTPIDETTFEAVSDAAAKPSIGRVYGDVFLWEWIYAGETSNPLTNLRVRQWMYRQDDRHITNRVIITKLGIQVAQVTEYFSKP